MGHETTQAEGDSDARGGNSRGVSHEGAPGRCSEGLAGPEYVWLQRIGFGVPEAFGDPVACEVESARRRKGQRKFGPSD